MIIKHKIIILVATVAVLTSTLAVVSSASSASSGWNGYVYTSNMSLKSIVAKNTIGVDTGGASSDAGFFYTLADYAQVGRKRSEWRYMSQVLNMPQVNDVPDLNKIRNNFTLLGSVDESDASLPVLSLYNSYYNVTSNNQQKTLVNPFDSEEIVFYFNDFVVYDDPNYNYFWQYVDVFSVDNIASYVLEFNCLYLENSEYKSEPFSFVVGDYDLFYDNSYSDNIAGNTKVVLSYDTFDEAFKTVGFYSSTMGYYITDCKLTINYQLQSNGHYNNTSGYATNLVSDNADDVVEVWLNENRPIVTKFEGIGDISLTDWLVNAVGGFFDFELIPGITLGGIMYVAVGLGVLFMLLKFLL